MLLPFTDAWTRTNKFDGEMAQLFDGHYSRQTPGSRQFMPPGYTCVLRNGDGLVRFGWLFQLVGDDRQEGLNCTVFRNLSTSQSSALILEAEEYAFQVWVPGHPSLRDLGLRRMFTYVDPSQLRVSKKRGVEYCPYPFERCFIEAGWSATY